MKRPKICVCGSINMDLVITTPILPRPGETVLAHRLQEVPGGKGANQAVASARLGGEVWMVGCVGQDDFGQRLLTHLAAESVDVTGVSMTSGASGLAVVAVDDFGENSILVVSGANAQVVLHAAAQDTIAGCDIVVLQLEIPSDSVVQMIEYARHLGKYVLLNPAPAQKKIDSRLFEVDLICPNQREAEQILGASIASVDDALIAASRLVDLGSKAAVITLGAQGAVIADQRETAWLPPFKIQAIDTTAAGDAFIGALAFQLAQGMDLPTAARFACAAGALAATVPGAQPSLPSLPAVEALLATS